MLRRRALYILVWCSSTIGLAVADAVGIVKSIAVEMVQFARANTVSPGYIITEISDYIPEETKEIWRDKIPMG